MKGDDELPLLYFQEKNNMADPVTQQDLAAFERNVDASFYSTRGDIKDTRYDVNNHVNAAVNSLSQQIDAIDDTVTAQLVTLQRDTQDIRAQVISAQQAMVTGFLGVTKDTEINALKTQAALNAQSVYISDKIDADGAKTRELINDLKTQDLNRMLIERNAEIVENRHYRHHSDQAQWAALQSQIQAFGSQLGQAQASMVNFGTQLGVGQRATSNNVQ